MGLPPQTAQRPKNNAKVVRRSRRFRRVSPMVKVEKFLGSSQGRLGVIPDEVLHALGGFLRNSGSDQSSPAQKESGSSPLLRASTPVATQGLDLGQIGPTEASEGENSDSNLPKAGRPNQPSPHLVHTSSSGLGGITSSESPSASPQTGSTPRESSGQPPQRQEVRDLVPPSTNTRQAYLPRLPHSAAELSIQSQLDGSNTDRLASHGSKLGAPSESSRLPIREAPAKAPQGTREDIHAEFRRVAQLTSSASDNRSVTGRSSHKPPQRALSTQVAAATRGGSNDSRSASAPIPRVPPTQQGNLDRGAAQANRSDTGEAGTQPRQETPSAGLMTKTSASENGTDSARSGDRTPPPMVKTAAPVARSEVAAISHTPAQLKASFVLPSQSSAQNVDAGSVQTEAYQGASSTASRVRSVEQLVDMAALHRKIDSHQMNLLLSDDRIGRMSVRLVERGGVINTLVRTDSTRASHLFTEGPPSLLESLAHRGLQASNSGAGHFLGSWEDAQSRQGGRYRPPRHPHRQSRRGGSETGRVFRLEFK